MKRNMYFSFCLVAFMGLIVHQRNTPEHDLGVISRQGILQCWMIVTYEIATKRPETGARESEYIPILSDQLPDKSHTPVTFVFRFARNIWLLSSTPKVWQPQYPWSCGWRHRLILDTIISNNGKCILQPNIISSQHNTHKMIIEHRDTSMHIRALSPDMYIWVSLLTRCPRWPAIAWYSGSLQPKMECCSRKCNAALHADTIFSLCIYTYTHTHIYIWVSHFIRCHWWLVTNEWPPVVEEQNIIAWRRQCRVFRTNSRRSDWCDMGEDVGVGVWA